METPNMLRGFSAQLNGTQLTWLDQPAVDLLEARVLVVVNDLNLTEQDASKPARYDMSNLAGRLQWRGNAVAVQRAQRDAR
jgi:hypothetical protein